MRHPGRILTVGAFGIAAGVSVETIRFYQRKGLLRVPQRSHGTIRQYDDTDVKRVRFVKSAQQLGFSLDEVMGLLALQDGTHCAAARAAAEGKLEDVRLKLQNLRRIESALKQLVTACSTTRKSVSCPLIAALHEPRPLQPKPQARIGRQEPRVRSREGTRRVS
jgi:MerR family mercuric resistance operon transcriptional regulator